MDGVYKNYAVSDNNNSDEGVQVLEQEALIDGSSQLAKFSFRELEPTMNRLVRSDP